MKDEIKKLYNQFGVSKDTTNFRIKEFGNKYEGGVRVRVDLGEFIYDKEFYLNNFYNFQETIEKDCRMIIKYLREQKLRKLGL